jgi:hypothetical protein
LVQIPRLSADTAGAEQESRRVQPQQRMTLSGRRASGRSNPRSDKPVRERVGRNRAHFPNSPVQLVIGRRRSPKLIFGPGGR